ncbi:maestro heat-like repeat-containing protein family member 1 isoform X7 [Felis catus]|uniref:maestro heat-like repeat-containing protein family member 1 isoform X7 n=1 Tax=Felis catus TaxID=9685 RepID=UPI001D1A028E|nr:maestro heat-like repeat-containing protein family member 1 isoform X7 [Felis catus]
MAEPYVKKLSTVLLEAITDKDPLVQEQVCGALCALGEAQPAEVLRACEEYLWQHEKLAHPYRTMILRAMETVVSSHISDLDKDMARAVIFLASSEMTRVKDLVCDWQQAASNVLVAVGKQFIGLVMEEVLSKFQPGALPHYFVVQTLANLAASNVFGMVPFLTSILSTMLPMLGMAKHDTMRVAFCCALQHFSESTLEYLANLDQAPDPTVRKDTFATDIFSAYDILFNHWLQSREAKLRLAVVEALGPMSHLLPSEKLEEQLPKLLPGVLALYRKHAETFHVSKSLGQILEAAVSVGSRTLEAQLDALLAALHAQICVPVESSSPLVVSNRKEVLRCFTVLACCSPDRLLAFLLPKLDANNERTRVGTLQVVRHVINSAASQMEVRKPFILSSMRLPLLDTNSKVKRAVVQVISAMAHHGYLEQPGGEAMVAYIVQQCALPPEAEPQKPGPDSEDPATDSVRDVSISTLYLVSTTVDRMSHVLWPHLLEFLTPVRFTGALTPLCRSLVHLAQKREEVGADAFLIQYDSNVTLPSPYAITTRLLTVSSNPYLGDGRGAASLRLLSVLHRNIHPLLGQRWATTVPLLLEHLDEHTEETLSQKEWEERLLAFLRDTLAVVSDNTWICQLSLEMCRQLPCYNGTPQEKNFLYKCIGTTLGAASSKEVVRKHLQELLETARHQEEAEREGLACCFGICATSHLDDVLAQLEDFMRSDVFRRSTGIFNIFKDRSENEVEKVKSTLILCYGHVAARAPRELVLAKVESDILRNIFQYFSTKVLGIKVETKDPALKLCLIQSVCMASQAICSSAQAGSFHFSRKAELVAQMMEFIKAEPPDSLRTPIRKKAMLACTYLVSLEPALEERVQADLIRGCLHSVMGVLPEPEGEEDRQESLYLDTMRALEDLLTSLLRRNMTPQGLQIMVEHLSPWIRSPRGHERVRALGLSACLLQHFLEHLHVSALVPFHNLGLLIGLFSPRCADLWPATRQEAVSCVHALLYLQLGYEGFSRDYRDDVAEQLLALKEGLVHPDPAVLFHTCHGIAQIIAKRLPPEQLISLLLTLFESLGDPDKNCSRAATIMVNCLLRERGSMLQEKPHLHPVAGAGPGAQPHRTGPGAAPGEDEQGRPVQGDPGLPAKQLPWPRGHAAAPCGHVCPARGPERPGVWARGARAVPAAVCRAPAAGQLHPGRPAAPEPAGQGEEERGLGRGPQEPRALQPRCSALGPCSFCTRAASSGRKRAVASPPLPRAPYRGQIPSPAGRAQHQPLHHWPVQAPSLSALFGGAGPGGLPSGPWGGRAGQAGWSCLREVVGGRPQQLGRRSLGSSLGPPQWHFGAQSTAPGPRGKGRKLIPQGLQTSPPVPGTWGRTGPVPRGGDRRGQRQYAPPRRHRRHRSTRAWRSGRGRVPEPGAHPALRRPSRKCECAGRHRRDCTPRLASPQRGPWAATP